MRHGCVQPTRFVRETRLTARNSRKSRRAVVRHRCVRSPRDGAQRKPFTPTKATRTKTILHPCRDIFARGVERVCELANDGIRHGRVVQYGRVIKEVIEQVSVGGRKEGAFGRITVEKK